MDRKWLIIPDYGHLSESEALAAEYGAAFEYNDFCSPSVYENTREIEERIRVYSGLNRDKSQDTMHGLFLDILFASSDSVIRKRSRELVELSFEIGKRLGVRGIVFHTGILAGLTLDSYVNPWLETAEDFWRKMSKKYPDVDIYMENTFERSPDVLIRLRERLTDCENFKLCLDYGHACLTPEPIDSWVERMSRYIGHMHLNDNDLKADLHAVPGEGRIDWKQCSQLLDSYQIDCPILLELNGVERQRRALEYMSRV